MGRPDIVDRTIPLREKNAGFIRLFFECEILPLPKKAMRVREIVDVHPEAPGKTFRFPPGKIDEAGLATTRTALMTLEGSHKEKGHDLQHTTHVVLGTWIVDRLKF